MSTSIGKQAENYAEVIVGQIASNFKDLDFAIRNCPDLKKAQKEYDTSDKEGLELKELQDKIDIIKESIGSGLCDDKYTAIEPLAVGLFGEWGSGKTHQLKLIKQRIRRVQDADKKKKRNKTFPKRTIPIFFNAWRFEKEEHIILPLFETLLKEVEAFERPVGEKGKVIVNKLTTKLKIGALSLHKGLKAPDSFKSVAVDALSGNYGGALMQFFDTGKFVEEFTEKSNEKLVGDQKIGEMLNPEKLESIYLNITEWIKYITLTEDVNFVFLIDDLDRCLPENTLKMLESIKLFLDVPSCAFILAVDDDVVERGVVHHYRDYLSIYHHKDTEDAKGVLQHDLPITGHEYLEKMIQLPIRLPVIDTVNVREFLEEHSKGWKEYLNLDDTLDKQETHDVTTRGKLKETDNYEMLLDFFESKIPAKPRKIKRTALLYQAKLELLDGLEIQYDNNIHILIAKITLLELFAPKLLRFIQNNGYDSIYNRLVEFSKTQRSLTEFDSIKEYIERQDYVPGEERNKEADQKEEDNLKDYYTQKDQQIYKRMMHIVKEHYTSRIQFDLDMVFDQNEDKNNLQKIIEMREKVHIEEKEAYELKSNQFWDKLFKPNDVQSWRDAFKVDKLFKEGKATLTDEQLKNIMAEAKVKELHLVPEWRKAIVPYITGEQLKDDIYFEMMPTTVTKREFRDFVEATKYKTDAQKGDGAYVYNGKEWEKKKDAYWDNSYIKDESDEHPVVCVSWNDTQAYITWKNKTDNKYTYVLPTEDEWYLACNNGKDTKWHFGDDERQLEKYAWYRKNSGMKTHEVRKRDENELGLYDMHGNVWEWCEDWYDNDEDTKVLRGGSWYSYAYNTQASIRNRSGPTSSGINIGFRLQRTLHS